MMITAEIARARAKTMLVNSIEKEITNAAESGYLETTTGSFYTDNEVKAISAILTQAGYLCTKVEYKRGESIIMKYGETAYRIFISWEKEQVTPR